MVIVVVTKQMFFALLLLLLLLVVVVVVVDALMLPLFIMLSMMLSLSSIHMQMLIDGNWDVDQDCLLGQFKCVKNIDGQKHISLTNF